MGPYRVTDARGLVGIEHRHRPDEEPARHLADEGHVRRGGLQGECAEEDREAGEDQSPHRLAVQDLAQAVGAAETEEEYKVDKKPAAAKVAPEQLADYIAQLEKEMYEAAEKLEFERAAELRDQIAELRKELIGFAG